MSREVNAAADLLARGRSTTAAEDAAAADQALDPASNPDLARVMDEYMQRMESRWVDQSIPALGGLTPRAALGDTEMRPALEALLDDMEWQQRHSSGGGMSATRIRALLGVPAKPR
jgi:hypothetical protein